MDRRDIGTGGAGDGVVVVSADDSGRQTIAGHLPSPHAAPLRHYPPLSCDRLSTGARGRRAKARQALMSLAGEIGIVREDLLLCHAGCEPGERIIDRDAHTADRRFATALSRFQRDTVPVFYRRLLRYRFRYRTSQGVEETNPMTRSADARSVGDHYLPPLSALFADKGGVRQGFIGCGRGPGWPRKQPRYARSFVGRPWPSGTGFEPLSPRIRPALGWVAS